ncbi:MAG: hypothetical protein ACKON9_23010 [Planctomycetaceae bacterium]
MSRTVVPLQGLIRVFEQQIADSRVSGESAFFYPFTAVYSADTSSMG